MDVERENVRSTVLVCFADILCKTKRRWQQAVCMHLMKETEVIHVLETRLRVVTAIRLGASFGFGLGLAARRWSGFHSASFRRRSCCCIVRLSTSGERRRGCL